MSLVVFIIFMERISRCSQAAERIKFGGLQIPSLLFADGTVLLALSNSDLQLSLEPFAAECQMAGMRISTSKSKAMVLSWKRVDCPLLGCGRVASPSEGVQVSRGLVQE